MSNKIKCLDHIFIYIYTKYCFYNIFININDYFYNNLNSMNHSISTMSGKTKIKIVLLGGQAVGKSSII